MGEASYDAACASVKRSRTYGNVNPVLALGLLAAVGLLATRLPRFAVRRPLGPDLVLAAGGPLVLLGLVLGPGIDLLDWPVLRALGPVTALAIGWIGAVLGARLEWRHVRRIPRGVWFLALACAGAVVLTVAAGAWLLTRLIPALGAVWVPQLPAVLTLAAAAGLSGPEAVTVVARTLRVRRSVAHAFGLAAALETACGALLMTVPLALHAPPPHPLAGDGPVGWLYWIAFAMGSGTLVGLLFLSLTRLRPAPEDLGFALLGTLLFGAGIGYAADLSPFVVCALAAVVIVNRSPWRRPLRQLLAAWEHPIYAVLLVVAGALLTLPTAWLFVAVLLLAALRVGARWASVRYGQIAFKVADLPPHAGLATVAQGGTAMALGINYFIMYGGGPEHPGAGGAVLTTIVLGVAVAQLAAPSLMQVALRPGPARLTPGPAGPELTPNAPAE